MTTPPAQPKFYHITYVGNFASTVAAGFIEADGRRVGQGGSDVHRHNRNQAAPVGRDSGFVPSGYYEGDTHD